MTEHMSSKEDVSEDLYGRLSMWRAFGGNAARVAIVFKVPYQSLAAEALSVVFSPVSYLTDIEIQNVFREVIGNITREREFLQSLSQQDIVAAVFVMLTTAVTCLKHKGFHEEREWRVVHAPVRQPSPLVTKIIREVAGVPQPIYQLPLDKAVSSTLEDIDLPRMFDRLIIGPTPYPWPIYQAFVDALKCAGVPDASERVWRSDIPIRA